MSKTVTNKCWGKHTFVREVSDVVIKMSRYGSEMDFGVVR